MNETQPLLIWRCTDGLWTLSPYRSAYETEYCLYPLLACNHWADRDQAQGEYRTVVEGDGELDGTRSPQLIQVIAEPSSGNLGLPISV